MSSADETPIPAFKKRKFQRACDSCRRKKIKCDGSEMIDSRCSDCTAHRAECTYLQAPVKNSRYTKSYVEDLESRLESMEKLVSQLAAPGTDVAKTLDAEHPNSNAIQSVVAQSEQPHAGSGSRAVELPPSCPSLTIAPTPPAAADGNDPPSEDEAAELDEELTGPMQKLSMHLQPSRYHGKSSGLVFLRSALAFTNKRVGPLPALNMDEHQPWLKPFVDDDFPVFEASLFPPPDLLDPLVELYFHHMNSQFPLLHGPMFTQAVKAGKHLVEGGFGATVLLVCAIGSRFTRDPRVLLAESNYHPYSAGWKWFQAVERARRLSFAPAGLHDLQVYALMALFLYGSNAPAGIWAVVGAGIRAAVEVGVHRKRMYSPVPNVEEELWRRAFWILVLLEWTQGYGFGRPCSIHDEDFDLALPTECDDEYWLTPEGKPLFEQPADKPSKVSGFVQLLKLGQILAFANRTIYSTNKSGAQLGHADQQWEQRIVAEIDSALNKWAGSLPSHLRWNPEQENELFLIQAATIGAFYYLHQIAVHRAFMSRLSSSSSSSSRRESPMSPLSTIICVNAARSAIQMIEVLYNRTGNPTHGSMRVVFVAAMVLVRNMLGLKREGGVPDASTRKDLVLVGKSIEMLRTLRYEMHLSETLANLLANVVASVADPVPPKTSAGQRQPTTSQAETQHVPSRAETTQGREGPAHPDAALSVYLDVNFTLPGTYPFAMPSGPDICGQGFATPADGAIQLAAMQQEPLPASVTSLGAYDRSQDPPQNCGPSHSSSTALGSTVATAGAEIDAFGIGIGTARMFGLEDMDTAASGSMLWNAPHASQAGPHDSPQAALYHDHFAAVDAPTGEQDRGIDDFFTLMDDTLTMWPSMPPMFMWDEWGGHFDPAHPDRTGT